MSSESKTRLALGAAIVAGVSGLALHVSTPAEANLSPRAMKLLDPSQMFLQACGQGDKRSLLQQRVQMAMAGDPDPMAVFYETDPQLYEGLGEYGFQITTASPDARRFFEQGAALLYGFNHQEAVRAFRAGQRADPGCAMCYWGEAFAHGPNINAPMDPRTLGATRKALARAAALKDFISPKEAALITALEARYPGDDRVESDAAHDDAAYADAMLKVAERFPEDDNVLVLAAEAQMDTQPWDYWAPGGAQPKGRIPQALEMIDRVVARNPDHAQAAHLAIHLYEASTVAEKAEAAADRLATPLAPGSGHLVHMPGHLYYRLGRFADSIRVNVDAAKVDEAYLATSPIAGLYRFGYYPHNVHFIVTSAQMAGDFQTAVTQADKLRKILNADVTAQFPWTQPVDAAPYFAHAQFSDPATIMALSEPDARLPYVAASRFYARAIAQARLQDRAAFERELASFNAVRSDTDWQDMIDGNVPVPVLLELAETVAKAKFALWSGDAATAIPMLERAAELETQVNYMEPPYWYYPVKQTLGAAKHMIGDHAGAAQAFREALYDSPGNGWALWGLAETLRASGDTDGAEAALAAFDRAWLGEKDWLEMARL